MKFRKGVHVFTADDQDIGVVDRVVLDPHTSEVTGVIVRQGVLFTEDKVVPIDLIGSATEERVTLRKSEQALHELPPFEERYFVSAHQAEAEDEAIPVPYADPLYAYPPLGTAWWINSPYGEVAPGDIAPDVVERVHRNIPEGMLAIKEGARVLSSEDAHVGDVEEVFTDPDTNRATHFVISKGLLFKAHKLIPTSWVHLPGEDEVTLNVTASVVESLPDYQS